MRFTVDEIVAITGGCLLSVPDSGANVVDNVTQDSRQARAGSLFVPIVAKRDGHDFIAASVEAGACAYFIAREARIAKVEKGLEITSDAVTIAATVTDKKVAVAAVAAIEVEDTRDALTLLAESARKRIGETPVVGVTGSVGKTTTKDLLSAVLRYDRQVHASEHSYNNEIGVPLTLLAVPESAVADGASDAHAVIVEMGSRGSGHIEHLCDIAKPTMGVVTTVGLVHTSEFGSLREVAAAKRELVECLPAAEHGGMAFLNADVPEVMAMSNSTEADVITFGTTGEADVGAEDIVMNDDLTSSFTLVDRGAVENSRNGFSVNEIRVTLAARGLHSVVNALAAAAVGLRLGVSLHNIAKGLLDPVLSPLRMDLVYAASGGMILNDCYNASPLSMRSALHSLALLPCKRRVAVLGVMAELGEHSADEHAAIAATAAELNVRIIAADAPEYVDFSNSGKIIHVLNQKEALEALNDLGGLDVDTAVLVKGSRVAGLERLIDALAKL